MFCDFQNDDQFLRKVYRKDEYYDPNNDTLAKLKAEIVKLTYEYGIKPIARDFMLDRNTVRDWKRNYETYGVAGLFTKKGKLDIGLLESCLKKYQK